MSRCINNNCNKDPLDNPNHVMWGLDFDFCCNKECYDLARRQMDRCLSKDLAKDLAKDKKS